MDVCRKCGVEMKKAYTDGMCCSCSSKHQEKGENLLFVFMVVSPVLFGLLAASGCLKIASVVLVFNFLLLAVFSADAY